MTTSIAGSGACCPLTLGEVCWQNGGTTGTAFAVFDPGTADVTFIDTITGNAIAAGLVVACPTEAAYIAVNAAATFIAATAAGATAAGLSSVTVTNVGTTNGTVLGTPLFPGETVTYNAYVDPVTRQFRRLPAITYVGTATAILHIATMN